MIFMKNKKEKNIKKSAIYAKSLSKLQIVLIQFLTFKEMPQKKGAFQNVSK